jgi:ADP-ribose pyrophosphatase YjhB (NUDIX family)
MCRPSPAQQLALWADQLRDISAMGLRFAGSSYDRERYKELQDLAVSMLAMATGQLPAQLEPLRAPVLSRPTPYAVGDAAIIDAQGRILLIRRADNGLWAMPGGALEVGETPAEGVTREALEESGVQCRPVALVGIFDSRLCNTPSRHHLYQICFLCEPASDIPERPPSHAHEVLDARWFAENDLPPNLDPGHVSRIPEAYRVWHGDRAAFFDKTTAGSRPAGTVPGRSRQRSPPASARRAQDPRCAG